MARVPVSPEYRSAPPSHRHPRHTQVCDCCRIHTRAALIRTYTAAVTWTIITITLLVIAYENAR